MREKSFYKRFSVYGPGGRRCSCCFPQDPKGKKAVKKQEKKTERMIFSKLVEDELKDF